MKLFSILLLTSLSALARNPMPLMPEPEVAPRQYASSRTRTQNDYTMKSKARSEFDEKSMLGLEFGAVGKSSSTKADILGMQALIGGRLFWRMPIPVIEDFYFKPSVGYFRRSENQGIVGIAQHSVEGGVVIQYALSNRRNFRWMVGLGQRMEALFSNISIGRVSGGGDPAFIYRLGPTTGFAFGVGQNMELVFDAELNFALVTPNQTYGGLTAGIAFGL